MNKWKIGFWICLVLLVGVTVTGLYSLIDQGVTLTYLRDSCGDTESDMKTLVTIINDTDFTKEQIREKLKTHDYYELMDFNKDEIHIKRLTLIFKDNKLDSIKKIW